MGAYSINGVRLICVLFLFAPCYCFLFGTAQHHPSTACQNVNCGHGRCTTVSFSTSTHCICDPGYIGSHCKDTDPCHHHDCNHGSCHVKNGQATCTCYNGYHGDICQINACHNVSCGHGRCMMDHYHRAHCYCDRGYIGSHCEDVNPCNNHNCGHGSCHVRNGHATCSCSSGYHGVNCEYNGCHNVNCGHGRCVISYSHHVYCSCPAGYSGSNCQNTDLCHNYHCTHGTCHVQNGHATCLCDSRHYGCEYSACHNIDCGHGRCMTDHYHHAHCNCDSGYSGSHCQYNACHNVDCGHGRCMIDHRHHAHCSCYSGYSGAHCTAYTTTTSPTTTPTTTTAPTTTTTVTKTTTITTTTPTPMPKTTPIATTTPVTTTAPTTTPKTTKTPTTPRSTTTPTSIIASTPYICISSAMADLANHVNSHNVFASSCLGDNYGGSEAFVLNHCNVSTPSTWSKGEPMTSLCNGLHKRTPVATFMNDEYNPGSDIAAIFMGCIGELIMEDSRDTVPRTRRYFKRWWKKDNLIPTGYSIAVKLLFFDIIGCLSSVMQIC